MKKTISCIFLVTAAVTGMAGSCSRSPEIPTKPVVGELIVTYEYPNYSLPFVVALDKGFFAEEGVKVTPKKIGTGDELDLSAVDVINGHDFYALKEGHGSVLAVHFFSRKADFEKAMLVKKSAGISDWKDFKGKSVIITDMGDFPVLTDEFAKHGLKAQGTEGRDVTIVGGGGAVAGFPRNKDAHAIYGGSSTILPLVRQYPRDLELRWKDLGKKEMGATPLVACSYVKASVLSAKKGAVRAYLKAIDRAIDFVRREPNAAVASLPRFFDVDKDWARNMEVYEFHKSSDVIEFSALSAKLGVDVQACLLDVSTR
jgi:ABC-type nitrate/sulfonate/bicarbonate transport system substrate-binding protein